MKYIALIVAILSGWVISQYLLEGAVGVYVSVLFAYHFFLAFLVAYMDWSGGFKLPMQQALTVHSAALILLLGFIAVRNYIPLFGLVSAFVPAFAFLETELVFGKQTEKHVSEAVPGLPYNASPEDNSEFVQYLKQPGRQFARAGRPIKDEYGLWLAERNRMRAANQAGGSATPGSAGNSQTH